MNRRLYLSAMPYLLLLIFSLLGTSPASGEAEVASTSPTFQYWVDPTRAQEIDPGSADFQPLPNQLLDIGLNKGAVWIKINFVRTLSLREDRYLSLDMIHLRELDFYESINGEITRHVQTGTDRPYSTRDVTTPHWAFLLSPEAGEHELLVRLTSRSPLLSKIEIVTPAGLVTSSSPHLVLYGAMIGLFVFLFVVGLAITIASRHRMFWFGQLLITGALFHILTTSGLGFAYLWPETPALNPLIARLSLSTAIGFTGLFCIEFLRTKTYAPKLAKTTQVLSMILIVSMILPMPAILPAFLPATSASVAILALVCALFSYQQRISGAALVIGSVIFFVASIMASILTAYSLLPRNLDYAVIVNTGLVVMVFFLASGMVLRISERAYQYAITNESTKAKTMFFATMSHEIRTPINGVLGMLNLLLKENLNEPQRRFATYANSSAESLLGLVNDILDFSKIEAGKMDLDLTEFDIVRMLEETTESFACIETNHHLEFILDTSHIQNGHIKGDPVRIRQILNNLLSNACKFTEAGEIRVYAKLTKQNRLSRLSISVEDTGIGIAAVKLPDLFTMFTQADGSTTRKYGGTGLGLSIAKNLCELMKGDLVATSKPGVGSKFSFYLSVEPLEPIDELPDLNNQSALIYDTNLRLAKTVGAYLTQWGAGVSVASNRREFIALLNIMQPDIVICDENYQQLVEPGTLFLRTVPQSAEELEEFAVTKPVTSSKLRRNIFEQPHIQPETPQPAAEQQPFKLLLVEDNLINTEVALGILEEYGYEDIEHAENGQEAIERLRLKKFDVVLMDCQMPVLDGYDATKQIRSGLAGCPADIPIIAMTANAMAGDREKCLASGMNDYISKPINPEQLATSLRNWL